MFCEISSNEHDRIRQSMLIIRITTTPIPTLEAKVRCTITTCTKAIHWPSYPVLWLSLARGKSH